MPKTSERQQLLEDLENIMKYASWNDLINETDSSSNSEDSSSCDEDENEVYTLARTLHYQVSQKRFLNRGPRTGRSKDYVLNYFLNQTDVDFRKITRVTRPTFFHILSLIEGDPVFHNNSHNPQHPIHWQLACALDRMGNDGQGVSHARSKLIWGIGQGIVHLYMRRVIHAICNLKGTYIRWPNREAREQTSRRMTRKGFKGVVGFVDGTCIPIHKKPSLQGNVFMDRKKRYSINTQIVCDDLNRVIFFMTGHAGSVGDARVFSGSTLALRPESAFSQGQYLLADSVYAASPTVVPAYKENQRDDQADAGERAKIEKFNTYLAKARVVNEHTIGILKSRWTSLQGMRIDINAIKDMRNFAEQVTAIIVLHNICLGRDPWEDEFLEQDEVNGANDAVERAVQASRLSAGQKKRWNVGNKCLAFHARRR